MPTTISGTTGISQVQDGVITTPKIADNAVIQEKIANNAVITRTIGAGVVNNEKIAEGAVVRVIQFVRSNRRVYNGVISNDLSVPTVTAGVQVLSGSIIPYTTTNQVLVKSVLNFTSTSNPNLYAMYFRNTTCIGATKVAPTNGNWGQQVIFEFLDTPNSINEQIYQLRIGTGDGQAIYVNGWNDGELGSSLINNGAYKTVITLTEIKG